MQKFPGDPLPLGPSAFDVYPNGSIGMENGTSMLAPVA